MKKLSKELIIKLHEMLIRKSGGSHGLRDESLLESAIESAFLTFDGRELYPCDLDKIINTSYSIIMNHCFIDGNKRIGILVLVILLKENGFKISWNDYDLVNLGLGIASGKINKEDFKIFILNKLEDNKRIINSDSDLIGPYDSFDDILKEIDVEN